MRLLSKVFRGVAPHCNVIVLLLLKDRIAICVVVRIELVASVHNVTTS